MTSGDKSTAIVITRPPEIVTCDSEVREPHVDTAGSVAGETVVVKPRVSGFNSAELNPSNLNLLKLVLLTSAKGRVLGPAAC